MEAWLVVKKRMADAQEPWKASGLTRGSGIPAPSGQYGVGCVDLMHQLPGDEKGLLVRLHYPTEATQRDGYSYSSWLPNKKYIKASLSADGAPLPGLLSFVVGGLISEQCLTLSFFKLFLIIHFCRPKNAFIGWSTIIWS